MNIPYVFKKCSKCGEWKVANTFNFHKLKKGKYGLLSSCKKCKGNYCKKRYQENSEKIKQYNKQYNQENKEKIKQKNKQYRQDNKEKIQQRQQQYYREHKQEIKQYQQQYRQQYYEEHRQNWKDYNKRYFESEKGQVALKKAKTKYNKSEKGQVAQFNGYNRRRTQLENNGGELTVEQWKECMEFFEWKCAYSGKSLGTKKNRSIDHIVPVNVGGSGHIWNCVPMDKSLNISKSNNNMEEWYSQQEFYSEERLNKIYEWQQYAYNKWNKQEEVI